MGRERADLEARPFSRRRLPPNSFQLAYTPALANQLLAWTRGHWGIKNKLHCRRDVTLREDGTRMKQTHQAQVVTTLNNFVIALATYLGFSNLASARRVFQAKFDALIFSTS